MALTTYLGPGITGSLDTIAVVVNVGLTVPSAASFAPGDTVTIGGDAFLGPTARLAAGVRFNVELGIAPELDIFAEQTFVTCVFATCEARVRRRDQFLVDTLKVNPPYDSSRLPVGITGQVGLPQIQLTDLLVENGRRITVSGAHEYVNLNWDLERFLCGDCLGGRVDLPGSRIDYKLLSVGLQTSMRMFTAFSVEPRIEIELDFNGVDFNWIERAPGGAVLRSGRSGVVTFAVGNSIGLVIPLPNSSTTIPVAPIVIPTLLLSVDSVGIRLENRLSRSRTISALQARYTMDAVNNPLPIGPDFAGATFNLGPAMNNQVASDTELFNFDVDLPLAFLQLEAIRVPLDTVRLAKEQPAITPTFGSALVRPTVPIPSQARLDPDADLTSDGDLFAQSLTLLNVGNVHLGNVEVDYTLRGGTPEGILAQGLLPVTGGYGRMLDPIALELPLTLVKGRRYRLTVAARANTPIGTAVVVNRELAIGRYDVGIGPADAAGTLPVSVYASTELDVGTIDPASIRLAGVAPTDSRWTGSGSSGILIMDFPRAAVFSAARATLGATSATLTSASVARMLFRDGAPLTQAQLDLLDRLGNGNGRADIGDLRAFLLATGELRAATDPGGATTNPELKTPVTLLLTGQKQDGQRVYGLSVLLLPPEAP